MLDTVLVDFDDTIHNTKKKDRKKFERIEKFLRKEGLELSGSLYDAWSEVHRQLHLQDKMEKHEDREYRMRKSLKKVLEGEVTGEVLDGCMEIYRDKSERIYFFDGTENFLRRLKAMDLRLYVLTTNDKELKITMLERESLFKYFHGFFESKEDFGLKKEKPEIYRRLLGKIDAEPEETAIVGDKTGSDGMAKKLGIKTVIVKRGDSDFDPSDREDWPEPDFLVNNLEEAVKAVEDLKSSQDEQ